jgi:hypothetical protein
VYILRYWNELSVCTPVGIGFGVNHSQACVGWLPGCAKFEPFCAKVRAVSRESQREALYRAKPASKMHTGFAQKRTGFEPIGLETALRFRATASRMGTKRDSQTVGVRNQPREAVFQVISCAQNSRGFAQNRIVFAQKSARKAIICQGVYGSKTGHTLSGSPVGRAGGRGGGGGYPAVRKRRLTRRIVIQSVAVDSSRVSDWQDRRRDPHHWPPIHGATR